MGRLKVSGLSKSFGSDTVFTNISFELRGGERLGLVGMNGAGKSTLLRCLIGEAEADTGSVVTTDNNTIGYLQQGTNFEGRTLWEEIRLAWHDVLACRDALHAMHAELEHSHDEQLLARYARLQERFENLGGYEYEAMTRSILHGLGFAEATWDRPADSFSGGQKTRINLARALVRRPDFLILDEPTNHLDIEMTEWLEDYLRSYRGGILVVSHDRYFLDAICTGILHLQDGKIKEYRGNYSKFARKKTAADKAALRAYEKQRAEIEATEAYIRRYKAGIKSKQARGRKSQLDRMERLEKPRSEATLRFHFQSATGTADKVIVAEELAAGYHGEDVFTDISLLVRQGESLGIIGPNGVGKSTLLSVLAGTKEPSRGRITIGNRVVLGYYSQEHHELHDDRTVLKEVMYEYGCGEDEARDILGGFLFRGDDVYQEIRFLSGGEKARLALLLLFLQEPNVIIMDEPTNHLDIPTREIIEEALANFGGTYIVVSHDRYFLDRLVRRILSFEDGILREYHGNYSYWREKRKELLDTGQIELPPEMEEKEVKSSVPAKEMAPKRNKKAPLGGNILRLTERMEALEQEIERNEVTKKMYLLQIEAAGDDETQLTTLAARLQETEEALAAQYKKWEEVAAAMEK